MWCGTLHLPSGWRWFVFENDRFPIWVGDYLVLSNKVHARIQGWGSSYLKEGCLEVVVSTSNLARVRGRLEETMFEVGGRPRPYPRTGARF